MCIRVYHDGVFIHSPFTCVCVYEVLVCMCHDCAFRVCMCMFLGRTSTCVCLLKSKIVGLKDKMAGAWIVGSKVCMLWNPHG